MNKHNTKLSLKAAMLAGAAGFGLSSAHAQSTNDKTIEFDIEAQELGAALTEFGIQSGKEVYFVEADVTGKTTNGVEGQYTSNRAIMLILAEADVPYTFDDNGTALVGNEYVRDASQGRESAPHPFRVAQLDQGEDVRDVTRDDESADAERREDVIVVTGTNIRGAETASPLRVIDKQEIELSGVTSVGELLEQLPQNFGGGLNEDGTEVTTSLQSVNSGKSTVNLRGLGASATLVLFNGRRLASNGNESQVDVSLIPVSAIERVEVLTDGASAIYGSDAIAGVVNFVMRKDYEGAETRFRYGTVTDGGLEEYRVVQSLGKNFGKSNIFASYQYYNRGDLQALERDQTVGAAPPAAPNREEIDILPSQESHSFLVTGNHNFSDKFSIEGDFLYSTREAEYDRILSPTLPFETVITSENDQYAAAVAASYDIGNSWNLEVAGVYGHNRSRTESPVPAFNLVNETGTEAELWSVEPKLTGTILELPAGNLEVAFGAQYREEDHIFENLAAGTIFNQGDRNIMAFYGEARIPVFGDDHAVPLFEKLELSLALRHEDYSDVGKSTDPKLGILWSPTDRLVLRGTWGTSFRAAALNQLDVDPTQTLALFANFPDPSMADGFTTAIVQQEGDLNLRPETSSAFTAGFDYSPAFIDGLNMSVSYFDVKFEDRISRPTTNLFGIFNQRDIFSSLILDNPSTADVDNLIGTLVNPLINITGQPFDASAVEALFDNRLRNLAETETSGLDFAVSYNTELDIGDIGFSVNGTYLFEFENRIAENAPTDDILDTYLNPIDFRLRAGTTWQNNGFSAGLFANYQDGYTNPFPGVEPDIDPWTTFDMYAAFDTEQRYSPLLNDIRISLSVRNLFDEDPPRTGDELSFSQTGLPSLLVNPITYDPANGSVLGRFVAFEVTKEF